MGTALSTYADAMERRGHRGVDAYIDGLPDWQHDICAELREIIWEADPGIEETIKLPVLPDFVLEGQPQRAATDAPVDRQQQPQRWLAAVAEEHKRGLVDPGSAGPGAGH